MIDDSRRPLLRVFVAAAYKPQLKKDRADNLEIETIDHVFECLLDWQKEFTGREVKKGAEPWNVYITKNPQTGHK